MYKLPLIVLLISSTVLCQAKPAENGASTNKSLPAAQETNTHANEQSNSSHATDASAKPIQPVKDDHDHQATRDKTSASSVTTAQSIVSTTLNGHVDPSKPNTTTVVPPTTSTTTPPSTSTVPPPPPTTSPKPTPSTSTIPPSSSHSPSPSPTTQPPPPSTTGHTPKPHTDGGFNTPSFLGGMILGLGLLAIGYVIFKFYQTRRDSSYRTL